MKPMSLRAAGVLADSINDDASTRKVYLLAAGLAVLGIALVIITVWFWRSTRPDPELLAPLEVMGAKRFKRLDGGEQRIVLDQSRPAGAKTMRWGVQRGKASADPEVGVGANLRRSLAPYEELRDPALIASAHEDIPSGVDHVRDAGTIDPSQSGDRSDALSVGAGAEAASEAELDSILAAVGAVVPGRPVDTSGGALPAGLIGSAPAAVPADLAGEQVADDQAATDQPAKDQPANDQPANHQAAMDQSAMDQPAMDQPADESTSAGATDAAGEASSQGQPSVEEPTIDQSAKGPAPAMLPAKEQSSTERSANEQAANEQAARRQLPEQPAKEQTGHDTSSAPPLIIVPVDHDLRPTSARSAPVDRRPRSPINGEAGVDRETGEINDDGDDGDQDLRDEPESIDPLLRMLNRNES